MLSAIEHPGKRLVMKTNIVLTGFMGTGKSTIGKRLAYILDKGFLDTDREIERITGQRIPEIFRRHGERRFRAEEKLALRRAACLRNYVISTGGGAVTHETEMDLLREHGWIVCLAVKVDTIVERLKRRKPQPPLDFKNLRHSVESMLEKREKFYRKADLYLDTSGLNINQIVNRIVEFVERRGG
ncbi:hypothetical protein SY88_17635 [Clostridiales bacterium PH28_bin88]|nr:hypothetical protein SY88_17635 [Clostridiales bacterium PH28_bin88]